MGYNMLWGLSELLIFCISAYDKWQMCGKECLRLKRLFQFVGPPFVLINSIDIYEETEFILKWK